MPLVSLLNNGNIPLRQSGVAIPRTAQLTAGETGLGTVLRGAGQALSDVAKQMREMELQAQRADDARQLVELEGMMNQAQIRQLEFQQQNQEQDAWLPQWEQESKALSDQLGKMKLSPEAQLTAKETIDKFSANGTLRVMGQSYAQSQNRAIQTGKNRLAVAQSPEEARQVGSMLQSSGVGTPEFWEAETMAAEEQAKRTQKQGFEDRFAVALDSEDGLTMMNETLAAIQSGAIDKDEGARRIRLAEVTQAKSAFRDAAKTDPIAARIELSSGKFPELKGRDEDAADAYARGILRDYQNKEAEYLADFVLKGSNPEDFRFVWHTSDAEKASMLQAATPKLKLTEAQAATLRLELDSKINGYSKENDPTGIEAVRISAQLAAARDAMPYAFSDLGDEWGNRSRKTASAVKMEIANNDAYLEKLYKPKMDALLDDKGNFKAGKEAEFRALQSEVTNLKQMYRKQLGNDATPEKAKKVSQDILTVPVADETVRYFDMFDSGDGIQVGVPSVIPSLDTPKTALPGQ